MSVGISVQSVESRDRQMQFAEVHITCSHVKVQNRRDICGVCFSLFFIPSMWIYTVPSYTIIICISLFKMFSSLMVASCVTSCLPLFPPPFHLLTLLLFLSLLPLKFSPLLLFPHSLFSPPSIITLLFPSPSSLPSSPDLFQFTLCY